MKGHIAVLEDDDSLRELFTLLLEEEGYSVAGYSTIASFISSLRAPLPDLFILDVRLPDGDGIQVCSLIKTTSATQHIPVIMMSAHRNFERENGICTAEAFIAKPFDIPALLERIRGLVAKN